MEVVGDLKDLEVTFSANCNESTPIVLVAAKANHLQVFHLLVVLADAVLIIHRGLQLLMLVLSNSTSS